MECYRSETAQDWQRISDTLRWSDETHLHRARASIAWKVGFISRAEIFNGSMRAVTTLSLISNRMATHCFLTRIHCPRPTICTIGTAFWDKGLGRAVNAGALQNDGSWRREFANGTVIFIIAMLKSNRSMLNLRKLVNKPLSTKLKIARQHSIAGNDGDIFLTLKP